MLVAGSGAILILLSSGSSLSLSSSESLFSPTFVTVVVAVIFVPFSSSSSFTFTSTFSCLVDATSRSENALKSAVNSTLWAQPASLPQSLRKWLPTASYVAFVSDFCDPLPNL